MSNYSVLKQDINNNIYENQTQQITGTVLNAILNEMTASLGAGYQFAGVATLGMNPGDPDQRVFYLAGEGIYTNFGGLQVPQGKLGVLKWDFRWTLQTIDGLGGGGANLTGYVSLASTDDLPEEGQPTLGYLCGTNLYLYVGTGGDTKEGKYQNCGSFRGPQGLQGDPGVGIATVTQTTTSTEDEGINVITVTKEDGTQSTFQVRNGSKGSQGIQGPQGVQGEPGRLQAQYKEVETLPTASADTVDYIYLVASQTPNTYDMYYTEENQGAYSWKSLGTTAVQLSDYATKAEVNQLEAKVDEKKDSFPFVTNLGLPIITSFKDIKIWGYGAKDVQYIQLLYFFNNRTADSRNVIQITIKALDGTTKNVQADLGNDAYYQKSGIRQYNFVEGTTTIGFVVVDWDVAPVSEFYGNTTNKFIVLSAACFINEKITIDSVPTTGSSNAVASGGVKSYVDEKENSNSVFYKADGYNYTGSGKDMPLMVKSLEIADTDYFGGYIWPYYIFNYSPLTTPPRSTFTLKHTSEDGQTTTDIIVEGANNEGYDINHEGIIAHNLLVGTTIIGKIVIDWDLYKGLEFYGNQTNHLLKVKRTCYKTSENSIDAVTYTAQLKTSEQKETARNNIGAIDKANDYSVKDNTKHIIKVDVLGNGDYTTISAACASINDGAYNNQYEIVVFPGIYYENDIHVPAYTHIHGLAPNTVVVSSKLQEGQTTLPVFDQEYASSKLSNMRIDSHTGYCIHFDRRLEGCSIRNENLYLFRDSQVSGDITGGGSFKDGTLYEWIGCTFDGRATNYGGSSACHTNVNANYENLRLVYRNCIFINSSLRVGSVGGFGHCVLEVDNCLFIDSILGCWISPNMRSLDEPWSYIVPNYEWQVIGGNNKGMSVYATSTAEALQVIADTRVEGQTIKLGGSALNDIFGPIVRYSKGGNLVHKATATGIYRVKDEQAGTPGYSEQRDVFQLWKRLGDCSVTNKTLTVQIDDGNVQTYTFDKDYLTTKDSESSILSAINSMFTGCTIQKYSSGQVDGWRNVNLIDKIQITAATDIRFGRWVTKEGNIATTATPLSDILGIAVSNTPKGEYADVWTGKNWFSYGPLDEGASYGSDDYGNIIKNATISLGVAKTQGILERL